MPGKKIKYAQRMVLILSKVKCGLILSCQKNSRIQNPFELVFRVTVGHGIRPIEKEM